MESIDTIALMLGASWAAGINLYAAILVLGLLNLTGYYALPEDMQLLSDPMVLATAAIMYCIEFFADKTPGVDTGWDALHTFIRIPAGAFMAAFAVGEATPAMEAVAYLAGGSMAAGAHATKAGTRVMINTSPEPFTNWFASLGEDALVISGLWTALAFPWVFLGGLVIFIAVAIWLLPKIWRGIRAMAARLRTLFARSPDAVAEPALPDETGT